jgi:anti-sigma regulatory factor (Ser/Thr protein kinase)
MCQATIVPRPRRICQWSFPGRRDQVGRARAFLAQFLDGCPVADEAILLVSELASNAVAHSASGQPGGTFTVRACIGDGGSLYAAVEDQGSRWSGDVTTAESPHGLYLLRELSATCGTRRGKQGWVTWFTIATQS